MPDAPLIEFEAVSKAYPPWPTGGRSLRTVLARRSPLLAGRRSRSWALHGIDLRVGAGEGVGVIGANGSGKSTLLRLAAGLTAPTGGRVSTAGGVAAVLSLNALFDPSLTGREGALTSVLIAGYRGGRAREVVAGALAFAELEEVADVPVRTYSDGMKLRLGFGVVAQLSPAALIVDELLAVGDLQFQSKCLARMRELRERGAGLLLASHSLDQVAALCERAVWLDGGEIAAAGSSEDVIARYQEESERRTRERTPPPAREGSEPGLELRRNRVGTQEVVIERARLSGPGGGPLIASGEGLSVKLALRCVGVEAVDDPILALAIHRVADGLRCYATDTAVDGVRVGRVAGLTEVEVEFPRLDLLPGEYELDLGCYSTDWQTVFDFHWRAYRLTVTGPGGEKGAMRAPHRWHVGGPR